MGTIDFLKGKLNEAAGQARGAAVTAKDKAGAFAAEHEGTAGGALDKAARFVNEKTDGRYAGQVGKVTEVARKGVARAADEAPSPSTAAGGTRMTGGTSTDGTPMSGPLR